MTCSMALSELTSELLIRNKSSIDFLVFFFLFTVIHRCVAVWQNDRVEIIANDRAFFHRISLFHMAEDSCLTQRATEPRLPTSLLLQRSDWSVMPQKIKQQWIRATRYSMPNALSVVDSSCVFLRVVSLLTNPTHPYSDPDVKKVSEPCLFFLQLDSASINYRTWLIGRLR